jgi:hypothetical protein
MTPQHRGIGVRTEILLFSLSLTLEPAGNTIFAARYHRFISNSLFGTEQGFAVGRFVFTVGSLWDGSADETNCAGIQNIQDRSAA